LISCYVVLLLGMQLVQQITVSSESETAKVCTRAYMVTTNEKSYMLTFLSLKGGFCKWLSDLMLSEWGWYYVVISTTECSVSFIITYIDVATWADQFSLCSWWRFSRFFCVQ